MTGEVLAYKAMWRLYFSYKRRRGLKFSNIFVTPTYLLKYFAPQYRISNIFHTPTHGVLVGWFPLEKSKKIVSP